MSYFSRLLIGLVIQEVESAKKGSIRKLVTCELCGKEYSYSAVRTGRGYALNLFFDRAGYAAAAARARAGLARVLENACDPVPCPACGWYQKDMVQRARKLRHRWMNQAALAMVPLAIILGVGALIASVMEDKATVPVLTIFLCLMAGLAAISAPVLPLVKHCLSSNYDPNSDPRRQRVKPRLPD